MSVVICKLPKAGLGNQLFPLLKAAVFAKLNDLPLVVTGYNQFKLGPYLRREKSKRKYKGYFTFQKSVIGEQMDRLFLRKYKRYEAVTEPAVKKIEGNAKERKKFLFGEIPHWSNYFEGLKEHRDLAIALFQEMLRSPIRERLQKETAPLIGVHIRMGDFRKLQQGENFANVGAVRTPELYFVDIIESIRKINGRELPVAVFTDGYKEELEKLLLLQDVKIVEGNPDIIDLLLLAKSKIIVTSAGSTFSYWSGFLSEAALIIHPDHLHQSIRPEETNQRWYEGVFDPVLPGGLLENNIKEIVYE